MEDFSIYAIAFIIMVAGPVRGYGYGHNKHCESLVNDWSEWGSCTVTCEGVGLQIRTRQLVQSESCDSQEVPCPIPGQWNDWSDVGGCSVTCGNGDQVESRQCTGAQNGGTCTDSNGDPALEEWQTKSCSAGPCPVPGQWNDWSDMGGCSVTCGIGDQVRRRRCIRARNGGTCTNTAGKPALEECRTNECNLGRCPEVGTWGAWRSIGGCSTTCEEGVQVRRRLCTGALYGGVCYTIDNEPAYREEILLVPCDLGACPIDGVWGEWSSITCEGPCGAANNIQTRECTPPQNGGEYCFDSNNEPALTETQTLEPCVSVCWCEYPGRYSMDGLSENSGLAVAAEDVSEDACKQACWDDPSCFGGSLWSSFYCIHSTLAGDDLLPSLMISPTLQQHVPSTYFIKSSSLTLIPDTAACPDNGVYSPHSPQT